MFQYPSGLELLSRKLLVQEALDMPLDIIVTYGITADTVNLLNSIGFSRVSDLAKLDETTALSALMALPDKEAVLELWRDVTVELAARNMRQSIDFKITSAISNFDSEYYAISTADSPSSRKRSSIFEDTSIFATGGSALHATGECKPCAWFHHKNGCISGDNCEFCHLCPVGEIRRRKKERAKAMKLGNN
jgi:hypothetical protein